MSKLLFCYGTLKRDGSRFRALQNERFIGIARTGPNFTLLQPPGGGYPAMIRQECEGVKPSRLGVWGELFEVRLEQMTVLDGIEGVPTLYDRADIPLQDIHLSFLPDSREAIESLENKIAVTYIYQRPIEQLKPLGNYWSNTNKR